MPVGSASAEPNFTFKLSHSTDGKARKIWGVASAEVLDREKEIVSQEAIQKALADFMALPILHWYHTERPVGWITKARGGIVTLEDGRKVPGLEVYGELKQTPDTDDIWKGVLNGTISEFSIRAIRTSGTRECNIPAAQRTSPCITKAMDLWSISLCPTGTAQNRTTFLEVVKAMTSGGSALVHPTVDGTKRSIRKTMAEPPIVDDASSQDSQVGQNPRDPVQKILEQMATSLDNLSEHLGVNQSDTEDEEEEKPEEDQDGIKGPTANPEEVTKCSKTCPLEKGDEDRTMSDKPDEKKDISKAEVSPQDSDVNSIVKAQADRIVSLEAELKTLKDQEAQADIVKAQDAKIAELTKELDIIKARTPQAKVVVMDPKLVKADREGLLDTPANGRLARINAILSR